MKIYFIKRRDDQDIWLDDCVFFVNQDKAQEYCDKLEAEEKAYWEGCRQRAFDRWRQVDDAYHLLLNQGHNAKEIFPYHKITWKSEAYPLKYAVDSIEVEE